MPIHADSAHFRFVTYNSLNAAIPDTYTGGAKLTRNAFIGFCASFVSDCVSNSIRVITTAKTASATTVGYVAVANSSACHLCPPRLCPRCCALLRRCLRTSHMCIRTDRRKHVVHEVLWFRSGAASVRHSLSAAVCCPRACFQLSRATVCGVCSVVAWAPKFCPTGFLRCFSVCCGDTSSRN